MEIIGEHRLRKNNFKNGMRPVHPGEVLRDDFLIPLGMSARALAKALHLPAPRINDILEYSLEETVPSRRLLW